MATELEPKPVLKSSPPLRKLDAEMEKYRTLMEPPSVFEDGFSWTSLIGAGFIALLMVPGAIYMGLLAGGGIGPAAQWVTVILFIEAAKRAHKTLRRPEIFVFFYIAGGMLATPFGGLLWNQFFVRSNAAAAAGIADQIPTWFAPHDPEVLRQRSFFMWPWMPVIGLIIFQNLIGKVNGSLLSYGLFRLTSDIERLPFPMAPVGAQGILALAEDADEAKDETKAWRWRTFSMGGAIGIGFSLLYVALPMISQALWNVRLEIFAIPWVDWSSKTQEWLPAVPTGLSFDLGNLIVGMVIPFFAMVGSVVGMVATIIVNPILQRTGRLPSWQSGDDTVTTVFKNNIDFYLSLGIGLAIALALIGFYSVWKGYLAKREETRARSSGEKTGEDVYSAGFLKRRGHIPLKYVVPIYVVTTLAYILLSGWLIDWHPGVMVVLFIYGFLYTPLISYVTARLDGTVGQVVEVPMVREAGFILSGYHGIPLWFIPIPLNNYGLGVTFYRQAELTGTRFWSIWKSDFLLFPIVLVSSIVFANLIWSLAPVPSSAYPFAERIWELEAKNQCVVMSSTLGEYSQFYQALSGWRIAFGAGLGVVVFSALNFFGMPVMLMYGVVRGLNQTLPHLVIPQFIGALLGRYYFERRMGVKWLKYAPVLSAGYFCGAGLVSVFALGIVFLSKAVFQTPF